MLTCVCICSFLLDICSVPAPTPGTTWRHLRKFKTPDDVCPSRLNGDSTCATPATCLCELILLFFCHACSNALRQYAWTSCSLPQLLQHALARITSTGGAQNWKDHRKMQTSGEGYERTAYSRLLQRNVYETAAVLQGVDIREDGHVRGHHCHHGVTVHTVYRPPGPHHSTWVKTKVLALIYLMNEFLGQWAQGVMSATMALGCHWSLIDTLLATSFERRVFWHQVQELL